jgi:serine/threonine-protein kinase RsbT
MAQGGNPASKRRSGVPEDAYDRLLAVLKKYMSEASAAAAIARAERTTGIDVRGLQPTSTPAFFSAVERAAATVLDRRNQALLHGELDFELSMSIGKSVSLAPSQSFDVRGELDIAVVRGRAREIVSALGGKSYDALRVMTLVSELARNIVLYTPGGRIDLTRRESPRSLVVYAVDEGSGIGNLNEIFAGRYRSKTGLGKGLVGAKRLSDRFEIQTSGTGTRIEAEVRF